MKKNNGNEMEASPNKKEKKTRRHLDGWNKAAVLVLTVVLTGCVCVFSLLVNVISDAPDFNPQQLVAGTSTHVYDRDGNVIAELGSEHRDNIEYEDLPQDLIDAFLSIEDSRFFQHNGFDLPRFISSALNNLSSGTLSQGGSTLTMQLVDNTWIRPMEEEEINNGETISRFESIRHKIQEIYLSLLTEQSIDKKAIIVNYLNLIWFGSDGGTRGVQNAAQYYFGKDVNELNLSECAFLAGVINAPQTYNPYNLDGDSTNHYEAATNRRNETLRMMYQHGYISEEERDLAMSTNLAYQLERGESYSGDPYQSYVEQVVNEVRELTGQDPYTVPMDIYTSMDSEAQQLAYNISNGEVYSFPNQYFNIGLTLVDNDSGEIVAIGPGRQYVGDSTSRNAATELQQPGSTMKPILDYAPTFDLLGWSTTHTVDDRADDYFHIGRDLQNSDGLYMGEITLADALGLSRNTPAAAALQELIDSQGSSYWVQYLKHLGFTDSVADAFDIQYSIGGGNMRASTVEMASAYSMMANSGTHIEAHTVRRVVIRDTNEVYRSDPQSNQVISEGAAYMISNLLEKVVSGGYYTFNYILDGDGSYPVYGKSGTTDWGDSGLQYGIPETAMKDEWAIAYTSEYSVAVWTGYTDTGIENGYYITQDVLNQAIASHAARAMLDQISDNPTDIARPDTVVEKASRDGGYILSEYYNTEESRTTGLDSRTRPSSGSSSSSDDEDFEAKCEADPTSDPSCPGYEEAMQQQEDLETRCAADPTVDPSCPGYEEAIQKQEEEEQARAACDAQGGIYINGECILSPSGGSGDDSSDSDAEDAGWDSWW